MLHDVIVPLDGSETACAALGPAAALARYLDSEVTVVACHRTDEEKAELAATVPDQLQQIAGTRHRLVLERADTSVGDVLGGHLARSPGRLLCMATGGRGRSAALFGSVATEILDAASGPVLLFGPGYQQGQFRCHGPMLVACPPGAYARQVLPTAGAFASRFDFELELVASHDPLVFAGMEATAPVPIEFGSEALQADLDACADELGAMISSDVASQVVCSASPARALVERAKQTNAAAIAMVTTNPGGLRRLVFGSTMADVLQAAPCPVLALHPGPVDHEQL